MTKEDLKYGNVVVLRNGEKYLFTYYEENDIFVDLTGDGFYYYRSIHFNTNDNIAKAIMKVYKDYTLKELLWERKEKLKLTEDEKVILRNIPKEFKYIARDRDGGLCVFGNEPRKTFGIWSYGGSCTEFCFNHMLQFIKWEDDEPYLIEDLLKE